MAGPYGRMCRDLFGQSLHIKGVLVLDDHARLTVPNASVNFLNVSGNVQTCGIIEKGGQEGIRVIGNLCMDDSFAIKTDVVRETSIGKGVIMKNQVNYNKFGFGKAYLNSDMSIPTNGSSTQIIFQQSQFESTFTTSNGLIHPGSNTTKTFVAPTTVTLPPPTGCTFGNVVVDTNLQIQANVIAQPGDTITIMLTNNGNITTPLAEYIYTIPSAFINNTVQSITFSSMQKISAGDQLDYYVTAGNISGNLTVGLRSGKHRSFASFDIVSLEP